MQTCPIAGVGVKPAQHRVCGGIFTPDPDARGTNDRAGVNDIRALTLRRPWPDLIRRGKDVENRTWDTSYRGTLLIHAGQGWDPQARWFAQDLVPVGSSYWTPGRHAQGIVAVVDLVDVCPGFPCKCGAWAMPQSRHWRFGDVQALAEPVPTKGALGLWRPSADVIEAVMAAEVTR